MPPATDTTPKSSSPLAHSIDGILGARVDAVIMADATANSVDDPEGSSTVASPAEGIESSSPSHSCVQQPSAAPSTAFVSTTPRPHSDGKSSGLIGGIISLIYNGESIIRVCRRRVSQEKASIPHHVHQLPAEGAGDCVREDALSRCVHPRGVSGPGGPD